MATAVPSRFAVLSIEDDDFKPKKTQKSTTTSKTNAKNKGDKPKQQQQQPQHQQQQANKKKQNKGKKKKMNNDDQQWEQWKQKDTMAIEEAYEQELHQAILLSKLAYEEQLVSTAKNEKDQEQIKKSGKKSKKATMSLVEFNSLSSSNIVPSPILPSESVDNKSKEIDAEFFERVEKETKEEITKGKEKDMLKARLNKIDDDITSAQLRVEIEKRDEIISQLRTEVHTLKEELTQVKERNKKLYQILSHGEMKDKASVLAEVAKLQEIRDELTSEVTSLHAQLEQERSKTRTSSADLKTSKQINKKRFENVGQ
ncbi:G kinase-anchoring protein 1 [Formica fusca]